MILPAARPRGPAVTEFWLSEIGAPAVVVSVGRVILSPSALPSSRRARSADIDPFQS